MDLIDFASLAVFDPLNYDGHASSFSSLHHSRECLLGIPGTSCSWRYFREHGVAIRRVNVSRRGVGSRLC